MSAYLPHIILLTALVVLAATRHHMLRFPAAVLLSAWAGALAAMVLV